MAFAKHHFVPFRKMSRGSYALIGTAESQCAVIFVHGFIGSSNGTWRKFQTMIDSHQTQYPGWSSADAYFLKYSSLRVDIDDIAEAILNFVKLVFPKPPSELLVPASVSDPPFAGLTSGLPDRTYTSLVLVGHSEGGLAIRRAVTLAAKRNLIRDSSGKERISVEASAILKSNLYLFAPAFLGYSPRGVLGPLSVANLLLRFSKAFVNMKDGRELALLKTDTEWLQADHSYVIAAFARVLFGTGESLVARGEYQRDFPCAPEPGRGHTTVCKPDEGYTRPLDFVTLSRREAHV